MTDQEQLQYVMEKLGYLIAKSEDTNEIVHKIEKSIEKKVDKEDYKPLCEEVHKNTDFRKSVKTQVTTIAVIISSIVGVATFFLTLFFG